MTLDVALLGPIAQVVWIDLILSADNAVVIALACRSLPDAQRRAGMALGIAAAITLRVLFAFVALEILEVPLLRFAAGVVLVYLGVKLACDDGHKRTDVPAARNLWSAVWTIGVADAIMSLDNVLALLAAARQNIAVFVFGILLSIPLIVWGSALIMPLMRRFPILAVGGGALLGWVAGELIAQDAWVSPQLREYGIDANLAAGLAAVVVLVVAILILRARASRMRDTRSGDDA
ncbi:MAG: TerC family protein [Hyphomicrobiales bacterium]|nr:TerC family protein [Hyphomicrobiales bacterium]